LQKVEPEATSPSPSPFDSTDEVSQPDAPPTKKKRISSKARPKPWTTSLKIHLRKTGPAYVISIVIALLSWIGSNLYSINREIGETTSKLISIEEKMANLRNEQQTTTAEQKQTNEKLMQELQKSTKSINSIVVYLKNKFNAYLD
jgi:hypothetical protein